MSAPNPGTKGACDRVSRRAYRVWCYNNQYDTTAQRAIMTQYVYIPLEGLTRAEGAARRTSAWTNDFHFVHSLFSWGSAPFLGFAERACARQERTQRAYDLGSILSAFFAHHNRPFLSLHFLLNTHVGWLALPANVYDEHIGRGAIITSIITGVRGLRVRINL